MIPSRSDVLLQNGRCSFEPRFRFTPSFSKNSLNHNLQVPRNVFLSFSFFLFKLNISIWSISHKPRYTVVLALQYVWEKASRQRGGKTFLTACCTRTGLHVESNQNRCMVFQEPIELKIRFRYANENRLVFSMETQLYPGTKCRHSQISHSTTEKHVNDTKNSDRYLINKQST